MFRKFANGNEKKNTAIYSAFGHDMTMALQNDQSTTSSLFNVKLFLY